MMKRLGFLLIFMALAVPAQARPSRWCGWWLRTQVGGDPGPSYNLARNWAHYGSAAFGPCVGCIVVWPHHVGRIVGAASNGTWIVESGNDGHAVRTRPRSLAGAIAFRLGGYSPRHSDWAAFLMWTALIAILIVLGLIAAFLMARDKATLTINRLDHEEPRR